MRGIAIITLSLSAAAQTNYFPLDAGNQWVYRSTSLGAESSWKLEVTGTETRGGYDYAVVEGFPAGKQWLRATPDNRILAFDPRTGSESVWYDFSTEGRPWNTGQDQCAPSAIIPKRADEYRGPIGEFNTALKIQYLPGACADAGLTQEVFLPWVGIVSRSTTSFTGPRTWDLVYAKLGSSTVISEPSVAFSLTLDRSVYRINPLSAQPRDTTPTLNARLTLRNNTPDPIPLEFGSGQTYDLSIKNSDGKEVYRWSEGRAFTMVFRSEKFSGESNWTITTSLKTSDGTPFPSGNYTAEAWLTTTGGPNYSSKVRFEIRQAP